MKRSDADAITITHDGAVLVEPMDDGACLVHFRIPGGAREKEHLLTSLRSAQDELWRRMGSTELGRPESPDTICRECREPLARHLTRGSRALECPNRCPGCGDHAVFSNSMPGADVIWMMDISAAPAGASRASGREIETEVNFCPFCGIDLRGVWVSGSR